VFPYESDTFDFIYLTSIFTHMLPKDMEQYFSEISRVLKKGGHCLITYFIMNDESLEYTKQQKSNIIFFDSGKGYYSPVKDVPEQAIAFQEKFIRELYTSYGLFFKEPVYYGSWCGRQEAVDFQDMVIVTKQQ